MCKKIIKKDSEVVAGFGNAFHAHTFCMECGKPVADFLRNTVEAKKKK